MLSAAKLVTEGNLLHTIETIEYVITIKKVPYCPHSHPALTLLILTYFFITRQSRQSIQTLNSSMLPISDFMMVKEGISSRNKLKFTSANGKIEDKDEETSSIISKLSNKSNNENTNIDNTCDPAENELTFTNTKMKSNNRQRRKSFLTRKHDSSFADSPFLPRRLEMDGKNFSFCNSPNNHTNITAKDISEHDNFNHLQKNQSKNQPMDRDKEDLTRILSKGSDMSLTLQASQETDSDPMFTQAITQITEHHTPKLSMNEVEMEDADNMFSEALTQTNGKYCKMDESSSDDSESMFSQRKTQTSNINLDTNCLLQKNIQQLRVIDCVQEIKSNKNESKEVSTTDIHQNTPAIFNEHGRNISKTNMIVNNGNNQISLTPIIETKDNTYQQPSFQNFSSGSLKNAIECLSTCLDSKTTSEMPKTELTSFPIVNSNREQVIGSSENSSEIGEPVRLEIDDEEELAVSIMTQAFSEHLSAEQSPGAKLSHHDTDEEANEDLPCTQPSFKFILEGVVAYVEVRTGSENRSACVKNRLESLGAKVLETLNTNCTHLVFKDGSLSSYNKAKKLGLYIVSVSWIEACRNDCSRLPEVSYPCSNRERYEAPGLFPKLRKAKSMQPKPEKDFIRALDMKISRKEKAKQRIEEKAKAAKKAEKDRLYNPFSYRVRNPFPDDYYNSPTSAANLSSKNHLVNKPTVLDRLKEYDSCFTTEKVMSPTFIEFISPSKRRSVDNNKSANEGKWHVPETPSPCKSDDLNTPLFNRIAERINRKNSNSHGAKIKSNRVHLSHNDESLPTGNQNLNSSHSKYLDIHSIERRSCRRETSCNDDTLDCSSNPSPIARKSFFDINTASNEPIKNNTEIPSNEYTYSKNYDGLDEQGLVLQTELERPKNIVRTRSNIKNAAKNGFYSKAPNIDTEKRKSVTQERPKRHIQNKAIADFTTASQSPSNISKSIVRTRSSNKYPSRLNPPANIKDKDVKVKIKSPKSNRKDQKKRRILFSDRSSLLAESPTGLTQEIEWKIPSPPKNISTKSRKSVAPLITGKSTTKIVRSTSGSLLYAEPPKSNVTNNKRQPRRSQVNSRTLKSTRDTAEENPDGSYEHVALDYSGCRNVNARQKRTDKRTILPSRRSTAEFQSPLGPVTRKMSSTKINLVPAPEEIAFTSCNKEDADLAKQLTKFYGANERTDSQGTTQSSNSSGSRVMRCKHKPRAIKIAASGKVSNTTTHVVCGSSTGKTASSQISDSGHDIKHPKVKRTVNILKGILHGCWILSVNWLYDSLELGYWADEEMYELVDFSPAVRNMRLEKEAFSSPSYGIRFTSVSDLVLQ